MVEVNGLLPLGVPSVSSAGVAALTPFCAASDRYLALPLGIGFRSGSTCWPVGDAGSLAFGDGISSLPVKPRVPALVPSIGTCWVGFGFIGPGERGSLCATAACVANRVKAIAHIALMRVWRTVAIDGVARSRKRKKAGGAFDHGRHPYRDRGVGLSSSCRSW